MLLKKTLSFALFAQAVLAFSSPASAAGDPARGANVFAEECAECHSVQPGRNKKGPSLAGIANRKAASIADYTYSPAMMASGIQWTPDRLDAYVTAPKKIVPGGKMKYDGLDDKASREDLISYLLTLH